MVTDWIRYPGRIHYYRGYVVRPHVAHTAPSLLLLPNEWGVSSWIKTWADRLAHEGYNVMVPDIYDGNTPSDENEARRWLNRLFQHDGDERVLAALHWLRNQSYTRAHRTGVISFGDLGMWALRTGKEEKFPPAALILFSPPLQEIINHVAQLHSAVQCHFGGEDPNVPPDRVDALHRSLEERGVVHEIHVYPGARHDFMRQDSPHYHSKAAHEAWEHMLMFLESHLNV